MLLRNIRIHSMEKLFLTLMLVVMVGACSESSPPSTKQEAAPSAEKSLAQLQKQADSGDAEAQFTLGEMYYKGKGVPMNNAEAMDWYQKAAAQGHSDAQYSLGWMYDIGEGVPMNNAEAMDWYQKAAVQGHAKAQFRLGHAYEFGFFGVPKDTAKAVEWYKKAMESFQKAAAQGDADAQYNLGEIYYRGKGVPKDTAKAMEWYKKAMESFQKAATEGDAKAQFNLGLMYDNGEGVPKNAAKAIEWYQKAAAQGHVLAQYDLGEMYYKGEGVPKDWVLAYAWFNLAATRAQGMGYNFAKKQRDSITLSSAQRAEAERLSSNWKLGQVLRREGESAWGIGATPGKKITGTAFVVSKQGHAITNYHVVADCKELRIQGRSELIQLITRDEVSDLALLKIPGEKHTAATLAPDPASLRQGQDIVVFGFPLDSVLSSGGNLTPGVVSAITGLGNNSNQIQITAPIQPGSSGSPVMNKKGHVVGVVSMKLSDAAMAKYTGSLPQNVNFAVSGQTLKAFMDANRVPYKTGWSFLSWEKSLIDLGEEARKWTTVVECWR